MKTSVNKYKVTPSPVENSSIRFKSTLRAVKKYGIEHPSLDADMPNMFGSAIGVKETLSKHIDLNRHWSRANYQTITSFEVLEHLQNPLLYLTCIYNHLYYGGKLFLTTPVKWMLKGKYHFHEFTKEELIFCLIKAGFNAEQIKITRIQAYTLRHFGIRPLIRKVRDMIYGQCFFVIAIK